MAENNEDVEQFIQDLMNMDESAKVRYYAEVFAQLMEHEVFADFVRVNFLIQHFVDKDTGALMVNVEHAPVTPSDAEEEVAGAFSNMAANRKL